MKMLHEGDFFALFENLADNSHGLFNIEQCTIEKIVLNASINPNLKADNLKANCSVKWYSFDTKDS